MDFFQRRKVLRSVSATDLIPYKLYGEEEIGNGTVSILYPRFKNIYLSRIFDPGRRKPFIPIRLDAKGSAVWNKIDGRLTSGAIIGEITTEKPELFPTPDNATMQILKFISLLYQQKYISFRQIG